MVCRSPRNFVTRIRTWFVARSELQPRHRALLAAREAQRSAQFLRACIPCALFASTAITLYTHARSFTTCSRRFCVLVSALILASQCRLRWQPFVGASHDLCHPITAGLTSVTFTGGCSISDLGGVASQLPRAVEQLLVQIRTQQPDVKMRVALAVAPGIHSKVRNHATRSACGKSASCRLNAFRNSDHARNAFSMRCFGSCAASAAL